MILCLLQQFYLNYYLSVHTSGYFELNHGEVGNMISIFCVQAKRLVWKGKDQMWGMKDVHLTNASIPGVRCLREMKASTIKRRRDTTYTSMMIAEIATVKYSWSSWKKATKTRIIGDRKAIPVRTAEETRHSIASAMEGKSKNHPMQCIPPNTAPTTDIQMSCATISRPPVSLA